MNDLPLYFIIFSLIGYIVAREYLYNNQLKFMTKLASGDPNPDKPASTEPSNPIAKEEPNEIPLTEDHPFILPKEFNLQVEGEEQTRPIKLE